MKKSAITFGEGCICCLFASFPVLLQFYVPFYVKREKLDNFMCLLEFEFTKRLNEDSQAIPATRQFVQKVAVTKGQ